MKSCIKIIELIIRSDYSQKIDFCVNKK